MKHLAILVAAVALILATACQDDQAAAEARAACGEFILTEHSLAQGELTPGEFRDRINSVQQRGANAEPAIQEATDRLLETMNQGDGSGFYEATSQMFSACANAGYYPQGLAETS